MPVHAWTKVDAGVFHVFHTAWMVKIRNALNDRLIAISPFRSKPPTAPPGVAFRATLKQVLTPRR